MSLRKSCLGLFLVCLSSLPAGAQLLPTDWQKAVVLIETQAKVNDQTNWQPVGTGFLIGKSVDGKAQEVFLVTAKHVLATALSRDKVLYLRIDAKSGGFERVQIRLGSQVNQNPRFLTGTQTTPGEQRWMMHLGYDIAVVDVSSVSVPNNLDNRLFDLTLLADQMAIDSLSLAPTDSVFIIVYDSDFGLRLVRGGMISAIVPNGTLLVEARNVHGDSGSPVVLQPVLSRKPGELAPVRPLIVGLISDVYSRLEPIGKLGNNATDLMFPQPMNLSVVQPSPRILEMISALSPN